MIRLIIAGPRDYYDRENVFCHIHMFQGKFGIDEIVSGGASGVDTLAEEYANLYQIPFKLFPVIPFFLSAFNFAAKSKK